MPPSEDRPACPKCGESKATLPLGEAFGAQLELIRQASSTQPATPAAEPVSPAGSGMNASPEQLVVGAVMQILFEVGKAAVETAVVRPAAGWWQSKGQAMMRERRERMISTLQSALDRHPELYVCATDDVVFVPGGRHTVPTRKAVELLFKDEDGRLMSMLGS